MKTLAIRGRPKMNNKLRRAGINCSIERDNTIRFSVNAENNRREPAPPPPVLLIFLKRPERSAGNNIVIARPWRVVGGWTGVGWALNSGSTRRVSVHADRRVQTSRGGDLAGDGIEGWVIRYLAGDVYVKSPTMDSSLDYQLW